ncbi:cupin domain-containing protein [Candidatus Methylospira mobilis]|uniref:Cupin domain-containing protein n=1 Tax=Candidatus Methylospira mobilis TaxID=1808979 RepID=A0A5Q0BID3_9GAMM|nr:cupin domain-containing protein [Candidatus Methylospira mobilis]QFY41917.1 cupin domain-containing protein [Candidatus Methylospira mobilis]WNV02902.1 cupin domain-containing protein [Candidatus Methylospira mobilis]
MTDIIVEHAPSEARMAELGVESCATWRKEVSTFERDFDKAETAYILEGEVVITPDKGGNQVSFGAGDLVTFPVGLSCTWAVRKPLFKH